MTSLETQTHTHPLCSHAANDFELFIIVFPLKFTFQMTASCGWFLEQSSHMINGIIFMVLLGLDQFIQFRVYRRMLKISINAVFYIFSGQQLNATISNCDVSYLYILTFNWHNRHNRPKITKCILFPLLFNFYFLLIIVLFSVCCLSLSILLILSICRFILYAMLLPYLIKKIDLISTSNNYFK